MTGDPARSADQSADWSALVDPTSSEQYCQSWLKLQCERLNGVRSGVVLLGEPDSGPFAPVAAWPDADVDVSVLEPAARRALTEREGIVHRLDPDADIAMQSVAYPIEVDGAVYGAAVLELQPRSESALQTLLAELHWGSAWLEALVRRQRIQAAEELTERLVTVLDLLATATEQATTHGASQAFVTELARAMGAERASVGFVRDAGVRVEAVSHNAHFGRQMNLIRAIEEAMDECVDQADTVLYPEVAESDGTTLEVVNRAAEQLARDHGAGAVCTVVLERDAEPIGALTVEMPQDAELGQQQVAMLESLAALVGPVLALMRDSEVGLLRRAGRSVRRASQAVVGPDRPLLKMALVSSAALVLLLAFLQGDYRVSARSKVEGVIQRSIVAPFSGYVSEALGRAGDLVEAGQVLVILDDRDLRLERLKWASQLEQLRKQQRDALAAGDRAQTRIFQAQAEQSSAQLALIEEHLRRTRVVAPFEGLIVEGDLSQSLGAPVERGEVLFVLAPLSRYRVVLQVDERDVAELEQGQQGMLTLTSLPDEAYEFVVNKVTPVATPGEGGNFFRVEGQLVGSPDRLRPGMEGVAKVYVGVRSQLWIWTHRFTDWVRLQLWYWLP